MPISLLIVEDHRFVREMICQRLASVKDFTIAGQTFNGAEAVTMAEQLKPDVCLMDIELPEINGIEATRRIVSANRNAKVLAFTATDKPATVASMIQAGAVGYVLKNSSSRDLIAAIRHVAQGHTYFSAESLKTALTGIPAAKPEPQPEPSLSKREIQIVVLICSGKTTKEIAQMLDISMRTVDSHRYRIMNRLALTSVSELTQYAIRHKIIPSK